jgi:hypothetical protein
MKYYKISYNPPISDIIKNELDYDIGIIFGGENCHVNHSAHCYIVRNSSDDNLKQFQGFVSKRSLGLRLVELDISTENLQGDVLESLANRQ